MNECFELHRQTNDGRMAVEWVTVDADAARGKAQRWARMYPNRRVLVQVYRDGFLVDTEDYTCVKRVR